MATAAVSSESVSPSGKQAKQQDAQERAGEAGADVELPLPQDQRDLVGDHVAHQAAEGAGRDAHDQDDRPGRAGLPRDRHAGGGRDRKRQRVEPDDGLVAGLEAVRGEERQDRRGARDREVVRAADPEHRIPPEHQIAERAAPDAGEAGEKEEPDDVELGARCDEAAGQREDEDRDQVEDGGAGGIAASLRRGRFSPTSIAVAGKLARQGHPAEKRRCVHCATLSQVSVNITSWLSSCADTDRLLRPVAALHAVVPQVCGPDLVRSAGHPLARQEERRP